MLLSKANHGFSVMKTLVAMYRKRS